jgi:hypothetical protein
VAFTITQYAQADPPEAGRPVRTLAELIISGSLARVEVTDKAGDRGTDKAAQATPSANYPPKALFLSGRAGQHVAGQPQFVQQGRAQHEKARD